LLAVESDHAVVGGGVIAFMEKESSSIRPAGCSFHAQAMVRRRWW